MFQRAREPTYLVLLRLENLLLRQQYASVYGYELVNGAGGRLKGPTVYRILQGLVDADILEKAPPRPGCEPQTEGSPRTFYRLTKSGQERLPEQIDAWQRRFPQLERP